MYHEAVRRTVIVVILRGAYELDEIKSCVIHHQARVLQVQAESIKINGACLTIRICCLSGGGAQGVKTSPSKKALNSSKEIETVKPFLGLGGG